MRASTLDAGTTSFAHANRGRLLSEATVFAKRSSRSLSFSPRALSLNSKRLGHALGFLGLSDPHHSPPGWCSCRCRPPRCRHQPNPMKTTPGSPHRSRGIHESPTKCLGVHQHSNLRLEVGEILVGLQARRSQSAKLSSLSSSPAMEGCAPADLRPGEEVVP